MSWIKLNSNLVRHRKLKNLARELNIPHVQAVGHLIVLWGNVLEFSEDGNISKWNKADIAEYAEWEGEPEAFYNALVNKGDGFIDEKDGELQIHDWWDYIGTYLTIKYRTNNPEKLAFIKSRYVDGDNHVIIPQKHHLDLLCFDKIYIHIKDLLETFYLKYQTKTTKTYVKEPNKDKSIMKTLLKDLSVEELKELIGRYFESNDPFIKQTGYTLGVFKSVINKLRTQKPTNTMNEL